MPRLKTFETDWGNLIFVEDPDRYRRPADEPEQLILSDEPDLPEVVVLVEEAMRRLDDRSRYLLEQYYLLDHRSNRELARAVDTPVSTTRRHLQNAVWKFRHLLHQVAFEALKEKIHELDNDPNFRGVGAQLLNSAAIRLLTMEANSD